MAWQDDDNRIRPHSSLANATPLQARRQATTQALPGHAPAELTTRAQQVHQPQRTPLPTG